MGKIISELILDLGKCPNQNMHENESAGFECGRFPKSEISSKSIFLTTVTTFNTVAKVATVFTATTVPIITVQSKLVLGNC